MPTQTAVPSSLYGSARYRRAEALREQVDGLVVEVVLAEVDELEPLLLGDDLGELPLVHELVLDEHLAQPAAAARGPLRAQRRAAPSERSPARTISSPSGRSRSWLWAANAIDAWKEEPARWIGWTRLLPAIPPSGHYALRRDRNPHQPLDPGRPLGGSHLHALVGAGSRHRARYLGHRPAEDRAHGGVRAARRAALPRRSQRARGAFSSPPPTRSPTRSTRPSSRGATARRVDWLIDTAGAAIGVAIAARLWR